MTKPYGCLPQSIGTSACPVLIDGRLPRVKKCGRKIRPFQPYANKTIQRI